MKVKEPKHTPRPWKSRISRWPDGKLSSTPTVYAPNGDDGGRHVCELYDNGQLEANGCLIGAAPDLLRASNHLLAELELAFPNGVPAGVDAWMATLRAAIAKAEGRAA